VRRVARAPRLARRVAFALALLLAAVLAGGAAASDLRQIESVGAAPIRPGDPNARPPRDAAVRAAVARGVEDVAQSLLPSGWEEALAPGEVGRSGPDDLDARLAVVLGKDPFEYATRFRVLEDRGVRPALFSKDPDVENEYVVLVEVFVDAGRLNERFESAGWIEEPQQADGGAVRIVLQDLSSFGAYDALRRTLIQDLGMTSAIPVELSRGRAVLSVTGPYDAEALQAALLRENGEGLRVVPLSREGQTLTLLVDYTPPPPPPASRAEDGPEDAAPSHR
jgi:hypothetical protein